MRSLTSEGGPRRLAGDLGVLSRSTEAIVSCGTLVDHGSKVLEEARRWWERTKQVDCTGYTVKDLI